MFVVSSDWSECVCGLTAGPESLSRATVRTGLRAGVTGAAGGTGASTATVTGWSGNQFLHSLPQQPRLCYTVEPTDTRVIKKVRDEATAETATFNW